MLLHGVCLFVNQERNDGLQKQLDALSFLNKRKAPKSKTSDKPSIASDTCNNYDTMLASEMQESSGKILPLTSIYRWCNIVDIEHIWRDQYAYSIRVC